MTDQTNGSADDVAPEESYELTLKGEGMTVERKVTRDAALQIVAIVMGGRLPSSVGTALPRRVSFEPTPAAPSPASSGGLSLREYLDEIGASRNVDKILGIAKFITDEQSAQTFTPATVKSQFQRAGEAAPGNFTRDFRWAVTNGWIAEAQDVPGEFYITTTGMKAIAERFSAEIKKSTGVAKLRPRRRKKTADA